VAEPATPDRPAPPRQKTPAELEAEIAQTRERLVGTLEELKIQTQPGNLARHAGRSVAGFFTDEYGGVRIDRVVMVGAGVVGFIAFRRWRSSRRCRC
jgi:hypothetical protein